MKKNRELLIIEDNPADYAHYLRLLDSAKHVFTDFYYVNGVENALAHLETTTPACCIMDYRLPDGNAKDLLQKIKLKFGELQFPIVVITGQENDSMAKELLQQGVQNYLIKSELTESRLTQVLSNAVNSFEENKVLAFKSNHDELTGLVNSQSFERHVDEAIDQFKKFQIPLCLIKLKIANIADINEQFGEATGDGLIKDIASKISSNINKGDTVARLHGSEFAVLFHSCESHIGHYMSQKLSAILNSEVDILSNRIAPMVSIGLSIASNAAPNTSDLLRQAGLALKQAIQSNLRYKKYLQEIDLSTKQRAANRSNIVSAIQKGEFNIDYRATFNTGDRCISSIEVFPNFGEHSDGFSEKEVLDICDHADISVKYYSYLFEKSFKLLRQWKNEGSNIKLSINFSAQSLNNKQLTESFFTQVYQFGLKPQDFIFDIAEQQLAYKVQDTKIAIDTLSSQGVTFAIDNFGTGFSSIELLATLNCQQLKIDKKLLAPRNDGVSTETLLTAICSLGHSLRLQVIADGVSSQETYELVDRCGCDGAQSLLFNHSSPFQSGWQPNAVSSVRAANAIDKVP